MSTTTATVARKASTERRIAIAETFAPVAVGTLAPLMNDSVAVLASLGYVGASTFLAANYMNRLPRGVLDNLGTSDILRAHSGTLFTSAVTTGTALSLGVLGGPAGTDAIMAGVAGITDRPIQGIVSLGWWTATLIVPVKLRRILFRHRPRATAATLPASTSKAPLTAAEEICRLWALNLSGPNCRYRGQELTVRTTGTHRWTGTITHPGGPVSIHKDPDAISAVYQRPAAWIQFTDGAHAGEKHITVNLIAPPELDTSTLQGAWKKFAARTGGVMANTHLENVTPDPATGGQAAVVVADDTIDKLPLPDRDSLAGALRTNTLLCSYSPEPGNPRRGRIRMMKHNPLQAGVPFPGTDVLKISKGGYVQLGRHVSGFPARVQFVDPKLGAKHLFVAGVTGSGKGGTVQIVALADHVNGHGIIYGDPKGSSNPDITTMAAYSGLGEIAVMGSMRVIYALMRWRIMESARLAMKNFIATPERPWIRFILDEAHTPLSEVQETKKEAGIILDALAAKARSLGIILCVVNQAVNAEKLGGSTALRMNVIQGGSLIMLRSDSGQQHLVSTGFEGVDPGQIPASWDVKRPLVYDENVELEDPLATYGLGYTLGPGGAAEMMRTFDLESAAPYIDPSRIVYPMDWPDWEHRDDIALEPVDETSAKAIVNGDERRPTQWTGADLTTKPAKPKTAAEKIRDFLQNAADPAHEEVVYVHRDVISKITGVEGSTLANTLSDLVKSGAILRNETERGEYASPLPTEPQEQK